MPWTGHRQKAGGRLPREIWFRSDAFDKSITDFSEGCADQNEHDYQEFVNAVKSGRLEAVEGV